ncbi:MAG: aspartate-semialdehyde dehydrogenase [Calditrichaceae bacterium]|nr:aspartate-semialdehyde dehydrogenase [Calditrichaceae bacterium]
MGQSTDRIPVAVLGSTGSVGQKFIQLLSNHPYFKVTEVAASERSAGKTYAEAVNWILPEPIPEDVAKLHVKECVPNKNCKVAFSGLDASVAGDVEEDFAKAGYIVVSNSKNHRQDTYVPLMIPEVNPDHIQLMEFQNYGEGKIVTNPNCSVIGMVIALKPIFDAFGLEAINVVTMQAISGAGFPGVASLTILDNVVPYIGGEEDKMELEPLKLLGSFTPQGIKFPDIPISAQCNRVGVLDGHTETVQIKLSKKASKQDIIDCWRAFKSEPQKLQLPSAPIQPIHYFDNPAYPQPRLHRNIENSMAVSVGRLRECKLFDYKFVVLSHNTVRGAAGGAILCAELLKAKNMLD